MDVFPMGSVRFMSCTLTCGKNRPILPDGLLAAYWLGVCFWG